MNTFLGILNILILVSILATPLLVCKKTGNTIHKNKTIVSILISTALVVLFAFVFAWWADHSDILLLKYYGYDFEIMLSDSERFKNVDPENIEIVNQLNKSIMGIGWPLKAIFSLVLFIPVALLTPVIYFLIKRKSSS